MTGETDGPGAAASGPGDAPKVTRQITSASTATPTPPIGDSTTDHSTVPSLPLGYDGHHDWRDGSTLGITTNDGASPRGVRRMVTVTFLVIGAIGVVLLAASLLVGDVLHIGHPDADGPFSVPAIAAFVGSFGFGGAIAAALTGGSSSVAVIVGVLAGVGVAFPTAWGTMLLARAAGRMRTDATPTRGDLVGRLGVVVTSIPAEGYGEVRVTIGGQPVKLNARSDKPVAMGARIFVVEAPTDTSVVVEETAAV